MFSKIKSHLFLVFWLWCLLIPFFVSAQSSSSTQAPLHDTASTLITLAKLLSWIRIPIANFAGKMMTNSLITGEVFKITGFLFQARSICRIVANFIIVGVVLQIIYSIAVSGKGVAELWTKIVRIAFASILINASWFLLSAVIDLSNLAVLGVSSIWYSLIDSTPGIKQGMLRQTIAVPKVVTYDRKTNENVVSVPWTSQISYQDSEVEKWIPTPDDMSGPLMYFGMAVFKLFDYLDINTANTFGSSATTDNASIVISFLLKLFLMIMFLAPLIALLIVNLVRMLLVWMRFALGPLIALRLGLGDAVAKDIWWLKGLFDIGNFSPLWSAKYSSTTDHFNIGNIIWALFTPVTVTATLFLSVIVVTSIFNGIANKSGGNETGSFWVISTGQYNQFAEGLVAIDGASINISNGGSVKMNGDFVKDTTDYIGWAFGYLIICLMTMGCMRAVFRVWLSTSSLLSHIWKSVMDTAKSTITKGITLPVWVWWAPVSLQSLHDNTFNFDKLKWAIDDEYIKPIQEQSDSKFKKMLAGSALWTKIWYKAPYTWWVIDFSTKWTNFIVDNDTKERKNTKDNMWTNKKNFEALSLDFFKKVYDKMYVNERTSWKADGKSREIQATIKDRLWKWWLEYLKETKVLSDIDKFYELDKDGNKVVGIKYEELFKTKELWERFESVMGKKWDLTSVSGPGLSWRSTGKTFEDRTYWNVGSK